MSILRKIIPAVLAVVFMFAVPGAAQAGRVEVNYGIPNGLAYQALITFLAFKYIWDDRQKQKTLKSR